MYCKLYGIEFSGERSSDGRAEMSAPRSNLQFHEFKMQRWTLIDGWMNEMKCRSSGGRAKNGEKHHKLFLSRNVQEKIKKFRELQNETQAKVAKKAGNGNR
jgi:hypothetical protein